MLSERRDYFHCGVCDLHFLDPKKRLDAEAEKRRYELHTNENHSGHAQFLSPLVKEIEKRVPAGALGLDFGSGPQPVMSQLLSRYAMDNYDPFFAPAKPAKEYDFIVATEVAEHFYAPGREFERLSALLRPGGWLGIMTQLWHSQIDFNNWYYRRDPTHVAFYSMKSFEWIASHQNWTALTQVGDRIVLLQRPIR